MVHMSAGFAALAGAMFLGRRQSHVANESHDPANVPFVILGTGMLWFGWFGFNAGSAMGASPNGGACVCNDEHSFGRGDAGVDLLRLDEGDQAVGAGGLHRGCRGSGRDHAGGGLCHDSRIDRDWVVASVVSNLAVHWKSKSTLDDTLDVFPCHGVGG